MLLLHCDNPTMATILAPKLERRFLVPANDVESGTPLPGLFSRLYMAPEMLEERTTFRAAVLNPLRPLIPPGLGTSTELLSIMVLLDWRANGLGGRGWKVGAGLDKRDKRGLKKICKVIVEVVTGVGVKVGGGGKLKYTGVLMRSVSDKNTV